MAIALLPDADEILALQRLAFISEAKIYNDYSLSPLMQTIEELKHDFSEQIFIKNVISAKIIGSVRGRVKDGTCHIGRLIVHPEFQNMGIGSDLMHEIEGVFKNQCKTFEIFTGHKSKKNIYLYNKLGYEAFRTKQITPDLSMVFMQKHVALPS